MIRAKAFGIYPSVYLCLCPLPFEGDLLLPLPFPFRAGELDLSGLCKDFLTSSETLAWLKRHLSPL